MRCELFTYLWTSPLFPGYYSNSVFEAEEMTEDGSGRVDLPDSFSEKDYLSTGNSDVSDCLDILIRYSLGQVFIIANSEISGIPAKPRNY